MGRGFADDEGENEVFEGQDLGGKDESSRIPVLSWNFSHTGVSIQKTSTSANTQRNQAELPAQANASSEGITGSVDQTKGDESQGFLRSDQSGGRSTAARLAAKSLVVGVPTGISCQYMNVKDVS